MKKIITPFYILAIIACLSIFTIFSCSRQNTNTNEINKAGFMVCYELGGEKRCDHTNAAEFMSEHMIKFYSIELDKQVIIKGDFTIIQLKK